MQNLSEIDILRISLIDDDDFTILNELLNSKMTSKTNDNFNNKLQEKIKHSKKNVSKIHKKIPNAEITNIRSKH